MSNFEIKDNEIILKGMTTSGEEVIIKLSMDEIMEARNKYIKENKDYVKKSMIEVFKALFI